MNNLFLLQSGGCYTLNFLLYVRGKLTVVWWFINTNLLSVIKNTDSVFKKNGNNVITAVLMLLMTIFLYSLRAQGSIEYDVCKTFVANACCKQIRKAGISCFEKNFVDKLQLDNCNDDHYKVKNDHRPYK